jgi:hypothetical protein
VQGETGEPNWNENGFLVLVSHQLRCGSSPLIVKHWGLFLSSCIQKPINFVQFEGADETHKVSSYKMKAMELVSDQLQKPVCLFTSFLYLNYDCHFKQLYRFPSALSESWDGTWNRHCHGSQLRRTWTPVSTLVSAGMSVLASTVFEEVSQVDGFASRGRKFVLHFKIKVQNCLHTWDLV